MRVLFLTDSLSDYDGVGRYTIRLIEALEALQPELEVEILLARKHRPTSQRIPEHWKVSVALPPDYFFYMSRVRFWISLLLAVRRVRGAAKRADLVHAIKDYPHNLVGYLGARLAGKPCIATAHGTYTVQPLLTPRHRRLARWLYPRFARMISVSRYTRGRLAELMQGSELSEEQICVIPNKVDASHYVASRELGARPWHAVPFTLSIGEVKERKGHHLALEAWARVASTREELHHFIVGKSSPDDPYRKRLERIAQEQGVQDRVHFLGNIDEDEKVDLLQRALVFLHTPVTAADGGFEGFGIVYLEASASGTPCIGSLDCGAEDAIVDGVTGLLVEQKVDAVEIALRRLLDQETGVELRRSMGEAGRALARETTWEANATRVLELYKEVLA